MSFQPLVYRPFSSALDTELLRRITRCMTLLMIEGEIELAWLREVQRRNTAIVEIVASNIVLGVPHATDEEMRNLCVDAYVSLRDGVLKIDDFVPSRELIRQYGADIQKRIDDARKKHDQAIASLTDLVHRSLVASAPKK